MLHKRFPLPVKFIIGFIYPREEIYIKTKNILSRKFGNIDFETESFPFNYTDYYEQEMGKGLLKRFISFRKLVNPDKFAKIKSSCVKIESKFSVTGRRQINIDPGYLNEAKLILTTTKDFFHRIYLGKGIYAEVTLYYKGDNFCDFPTTYPDYRTSEYKNVFLSIRELYRRQVKKI